MDVDLSGLSGRIEGQKTPAPGLLGVAPKPCGSMNYLYGQVELMRAVGNTRAKARCCRVSPNTTNVESSVVSRLGVCTCPTLVPGKSSWSIGQEAQAPHLCSASSLIAWFANFRQVVAVLLCETTHPHPTRRSESPESNFSNLSPHPALVLHSASCLF